MAAATLSFSFSLDSSKPHQTLPSTPSTTIFNHHPLSPYKSHRYNFKSSFSSSDSSSSSSSSSTHTVTTTGNYSFLDDPFRTGKFLSNEEVEKIKILDNFRYNQELESGSLCVRAMRPDETDVTVKLLAESFAESMLLPLGYETLLGFLVKQYLVERRAAFPHVVTLIGFYRNGVGSKDEDGGEGEVLAGTVEVCFNKKGANASPPTPTPPKSSPYVCNMTVKRPLRRRGIGWHLLKASEELISQMTYSREVYLHCRMIDTAPFNMYIKAGYNVVKTDSILILLLLQRRKHLMCKSLPVFDSSSELDLPASEEELTSSTNL